MLLDSNIIIYATKPEFSFINQILISNSIYYSAISHIEVLGYNKLDGSQRNQVESLLDTFNRIPVSDAIIFKATEIRQQKMMSLGDCLIASTAIVYNLPLVTRNTADFIHLKDIKLINPFE